MFFFQQGIFHPYYVSALAPAVAALCGAGAVALWRWAQRLVGRPGRADVAVLGVGLGRGARARPHAGLRAVAAHGHPGRGGGRRLGVVALRLPGALPRRAAAVAAIAGVLAVGAGPAAYSVTTAGCALNGNNVLAGPARRRPGGGVSAAAAAGRRPGASSDSELIAYLQAHQGSAKYLVAATGSQTTAGIILATGEPVVTIGGFSGQDPAPTVSQLAQLVADGELKYVLLSDGGGMGGPGARPVARSPRG